MVCLSGNRIENIIIRATDNPRVDSPICSGDNVLINGIESLIGSRPTRALSPPKSAAIAPVELASFQYIPNTIGFGEAQSPKINDYADGVDTMDFLMNL